MFQHPAWACEWSPCTLHVYFHHNELIADYTRTTNLSVDVPAYRELGLRGDGDVDERGLRREVLAHLDEDLEGVAPVQLLLLAVVLQQPLHELGRHRGVVLWVILFIVSRFFKSTFSSFQLCSKDFRVTQRALVGLT